MSLQTKRACWNNPVAEAMACGCPVLATHIGAVQDLDNNSFFSINGKFDADNLVHELVHMIVGIMNMPEYDIKNKIRQ